jgi:hypothetical protein
LASLRRTEFGPFTVAFPAARHEISVPLPADAPFFLSLRGALAGYREVVVEPDLIVPLRQGRQAVLRRLDLDRGGSADGEEVVHLVGPGGESVALVRRQEAGWRLARVL